jgi:hypothetical protein
MNIQILRVMIASIAILSMAAGPALAQVQTVDPNTAIDADVTPPSQQQQVPQANSVPYDGGAMSQQQPPAPAAPVPAAQEGESHALLQQGPVSASAQQPSSRTYKKDDLIGAAEGVFGKGAKGLAGLIENILKDQGEPNAYIAGREAGGAFVAGVRYGSGTLFHKVEGERAAYWTGPSVGFDAGGNAGATFILVYNLYDSQDLYKRFPAGEGNAYFVGGFTASYMRRGDVVLIPIRLGVGLRLGANIGYMKFREKQNWVPF